MCRLHRLIAHLQRRQVQFGFDLFDHLLAQLNRIAADFTVLQAAERGNIVDVAQIKRVAAFDALQRLGVGYRRQRQEAGQQQVARITQVNIHIHIPRFKGFTSHYALPGVGCSATKRLAIKPYSR